MARRAGGGGAGAEGGKALGFRPLYRQVKDVLVRRIADGVWPAGGVLPSEPELALDLGVSPGTVRKALDELAAENLVVRRQGRGTFVARHDEARILFQFFKLTPDSGELRYPDSTVLDQASAPANVEAARIFGLRAGARVVAIERTRSVNGRVCIVERIVLPPALFPKIETRELPNNLYEIYRSDYGITIAGAKERLKAVAATKRAGRLLGIAAGAPLLSIDRIAYDINGRPAEWRVSLCRTDQMHYACDLR